MGQALVKFFEWLIGAVWSVFQPVSEALVGFIESLLAKMQHLSPLALGIGEVLILLMFVGAPLFISYWLMRFVAGSMKKQMGQADAVITSALFAVAAGGALGSMFGVALSSGGIAIVFIALWILFTVAGFLFGSRPHIGMLPAVCIAGAIPLITILLGLTIYAQ